MPEKTGKAESWGTLNEKDSKCKRDSTLPIAMKTSASSAHSLKTKKCRALIFSPSPVMLSSDLSSISQNIQTVEGREWLTRLYVRSTCLVLKYTCYLIVNISINAFFNLTNSDLWVLQVFTLQSSKRQRENKAIRVLQDFWKEKCEGLLKSSFLNQIQWLKGPRKLQPCVKQQKYTHLRVHIIQTIRNNLSTKTAGKILCSGNWGHVPSCMYFKIIE